MLLLKDLHCPKTVPLYGHFVEGYEECGRLRMRPAMYPEDSVPEVHEFGKGNLSCVRGRVARNLHEPYGMDGGRACQCL